MFFIHIARIKLPTAAGFVRFRQQNENDCDKYSLTFAGIRHTVGNGGVLVVGRSEAASSDSKSSREKSKNLASRRSDVCVG